MGKRGALRVQPCPLLLRGPSLLLAQAGPPAYVYSRPLAPSVGQSSGDRARQFLSDEKAVEPAYRLDGTGVGRREEGLAAVVEVPGLQVLDFKGYVQLGFPLDILTVGCRILL